jgi:hypothetical protein
MARDAISRQYDVEKNTMTLTCEGKGGYRPGVITFYAKKGKSIDIDKIRESITATRLSGGTNMRVDSFEITAVGELDEKGATLKVPGIDVQFTLADDPSAKGTMQKLREAVQRGDKIANVTGRLPGWNGVFPKVLQGLAKMPETDRNQLMITSFEIVKK